MRVLTAAALVILAVTAVHSQEQDFRGVSVLVTVLDRAGSPVRNLQQQDFTLLDNGKPQDVVFFQSAMKPFRFVVLIDISNSVTSKLPLIRSAAEHFLANMQPEDRAQVGIFNEMTVFSGRFTKARDVSFPAPDPAALGSSRLYDALDEGLDRLASIGGYGAIVVFSDGSDTASRRRSSDVLTKARNQGVMIYTVGVHGDVVTLGGRLTIRQPLQKRELQRLADETGGGYFELTNTREPVASAFARIAQEIHSTYVLGFMPVQRDGKNHKLEVRAKPGMSVRARRGYVAPRD